MNTQRNLLNKCALVKSINCVWGLHVAEGSGEQRLIDARVNFLIIMNAWGQLLNLTTPTRNICLIKLIFGWDAKILYRCQWMPVDARGRHLVYLTFIFTTLTPGPFGEIYNLKKSDPNTFLAACAAWFNMFTEPNLVRTGRLNTSSHPGYCFIAMPNCKMSSGDKGQRQYWIKE